MLRRILTLLALSLLLLGVLAGCGGRGQEPTATPAPTEAPAAEAAPTEAPTEEAVAEAESTVEGAAEGAVAEAEATAEGTETPVEETAAEGEQAAEGAAEGAVAEAEATPEGTEVAAEETAAEGEQAAEGETAAEEAVPGEEASEGEIVATGTSTVTVESARAIPDILNQRNPAFTAISPDGTMLVYAITEGRFWNTTGSICVYTFADANVSCYEVDRDTYRGYMPAFFWSPDSTRVAYTENPIQLGNESDIWIMDVADGTMTNMTDDGVVGSWVAAEAGTYFLDYQPMWDKSTGDLYFWRSVPAGDLTISFQLMKLAGGEGEAELVQDVSEQLAGLLMTWDIEVFFLDGPSSLSPDGSTVAMVMQAFQSTSDDTRAGVWLLDVASGELTQVMQSADYMEAIPEWQGVPPLGRAVQWAGDSQGFIVLVTSTTSQLPLVVLYYVDAASGDMTPVYNFSEMESMQAMMTAPEDGIPPRYYSPWTATVSPSGDMVFMLSDLAGVAGLLTSPLPPTGDNPVVAGAAESYSSMGGTRTSTAETGKVVIYGFLLTTVEE